MMRVGLTGGLASGKSFVGHALEQLGCHLIRADDLGHQVLAPGGEAYDAVVQTFGAGLLDADRRIDRKRLAAEVFADQGRLQTLNDLVHPAVIRLEEEFAAHWAIEDPDGIVVVEAAILIETGSYRRFDKLVLVVCSLEQQVLRAMRRDGCTRQEAEARLSKQMPLADKRLYADYVIDTSGAKEATLEQTRQVFDSLRSIRK